MACQFVHSVKPDLAVQMFRFFYCALVSPDNRRTQGLSLSVYQQAALHLRGKGNCDYIRFFDTLYYILGRPADRGPPVLRILLRAVLPEKMHFIGNGTAFYEAAVDME